MTASQLPEARLSELAASQVDNELRAMAAELLAARETIERLTKERDDANAAELAHAQKLNSVCSAARENGTCACSYDSIDDVCMMHSPKLAAAVAERDAARAELLSMGVKCGLLETARDEARAEVERLRAELAAKQLEKRTPLPEATWVKIPLQHESGLTTWHGKRLRDLSADDFDACKADAARGLGSVDALLGVAEEARVRCALAKAAPIKTEDAQRGPSDEAAEQPKPAESKPVGWFRLNGVEFHPVDGTAEERERAVSILVDSLGIVLYPNPAGGA